MTYPKLGMNILQSQHVHPWGFQLEIEFLKDARDFFLCRRERDPKLKDLYSVMFLCRIFLSELLV